MCSVPKLNFCPVGIDMNHMDIQTDSQTKIYDMIIDIESLS